MNQIEVKDDPTNIHDYEKHHKVFKHKDCGGYLRVLTEVEEREFNKSYY